MLNKLLIYITITKRNSANDYETVVMIYNLCFLMTSSLSLSLSLQIVNKGTKLKSWAQTFLQHYSLYEE
jgi:type II secretory pathway component PulF